MKDRKYTLEKIARANKSEDNTAANVTTGSSNNRYKHAFCVILDNGKKAVVKSKLPPSLERSKLFKTGVDISLMEQSDR